VATFLLTLAGDKGEWTGVFAFSDSGVFLVDPYQYWRLPEFLSERISFRALRVPTVAGSPWPKVGRGRPAALRSQLFFH
jgi:hypothetical protein